MWYSLTAVIFLGSLTTEVTSKTLEEKVAAIDYVIKKAQSALGVESVGIAVGVVQNGTTVMATGYGKRDCESPVTNQTLFAIGSNTKAFTSYACDCLVTENGTLEYSDRVQKHLPSFRMSNEFTADHITVRDLLSHTSGLPRHEFLQVYSNFSRKEFLRRLPYLQTNFDLRRVFQYNNIMYAIAGLVIESVAGKPWEDVVRERIFEPLDMERTYTEIREVLEEHVEDVATGYSIPQGKGVESIQAVPYLEAHNENPAGGMYSCIEDLIKWAVAQLRLSGRSREMHLPQINIPYDPVTGPDFAYGLGWFLAYYHNHILVYHDGGINGFSSTIFLVPELDLGVITLTNLAPLGGFIHSLAYEILDIMTDRTSSEADLNQWVKGQAQGFVASRSTVTWDESNVRKNQDIDHPEQYAGSYKNKGYGVAELSAVGSELYLVYNTLRYRLIPKKADDFFSARSPFPDEFRFECLFARDPSGRVNAIFIDFETNVQRIFFTKEVPSDLYQVHYLQPFAGNYGFMQVDVNKRKGILVATSGDVQYAGDMTPYKRNWFYLRRAPMEFIVENGTVTGVEYHLGEYVFHAPKIRTA